MRNIALTLAYNGKNYAGFQVQKNADTVMAQIQRAIEAAIGEKTDVKGCSRTDSKVHAKGYVLSFKTHNPMPIEKVPFAINGRLPRDIAVLKAADMPEEFHPRYDCVAKEYVYKVYTGNCPDPFLADFTHHYPHHIDIALLQRCAQTFVGTYDFLGFCGSKNEQEDTTRTIFDFTVEKQGDLVVFTVRGDAFLYNMVRILVGTLLDVNTGRIAAGDLKAILQSKDRHLAGKTAPPQGLYLNRVFYRDQEI